MSLVITQKQSNIIVILIILLLFWYSRKYTSKKPSEIVDDKYRCNQQAGVSVTCTKCSPNSNGDYPEYCMPYEDCMNTCDVTN